MSKELTINLSKIREWTGCTGINMSQAVAYAQVARSEEKPLGIIARQRPIVAAILRKAPHEYVQRYYEDGIDLDTGESKGRWAACGVASCRSAHFTYRLCDGVTVVDDTAEDGEYEFVKVTSPSRGVWSFPHTWCELRGGRLGTDINKLRRHEEACILTNAVACRGYICTEVEDANGQRGFVRVWQGPSTQEGFGSIEVVGSRLLCLDGPLTPKNVVFRKGN